MEALDFILFNSVSLRELKKGVILNRETGIFCGQEFNETFGVFVPKSTDISKPIRWHGCVTWGVGGFEFETAIQDKILFHLITDYSPGVSEEECEYFIDFFMKKALEIQKEKYLDNAPKIDFRNITRKNPRLEAHEFGKSTKSTPKCAARWTNGQDKKFDDRFCDFLTTKSIDFGIRCTGT